MWLREPKKVIVLEGIRWSASTSWARFRRTQRLVGPLLVHPFARTAGPHGRRGAAVGNGVGTLTAAESRRAIETFLDGYINFAYRSLKSHRDGRPTEAHLDATESIPWALPVVFAAHRRVRPYNKYLPWEIAQHPFGDHRLDNGRLLSLLNNIVATGDPEAQRHMFAIIEEDVRRLGFGNVVDAWGDELSLFKSP